MKNRLGSMYPGCEVHLFETTEMVAKHVLDMNQIHILIIDDAVGDKMTSSELVQHIRFQEGHGENMIIVRWSSHAIDDGLADLVWHRNIEQDAMAKDLQDAVRRRLPSFHTLHFAIRFGLCPV